MQYFGALHGRISHLYACNCDSCKAGAFHLAAKAKSKPVEDAADAAYKHLHNKGAYSPKDLGTDKPYKDLISATRDAFTPALTDNDIPAEMAKGLKEDLFYFSCLKTHAQLFEASRLISRPDGTRKGFDEFALDVSKIKENYNRNYLEAEYQFATSSVQMAAKWAAAQEGNGRYNLQYRTAGDERVRASHRALDGITLPIDDTFWTSYYPPNGWRCRCTTQEVRKGKYDVSDSEEAAKAGATATTSIGKSGKNKLEIFRFNPGIEKVIFPPDHPYSKVVGAVAAKKAIAADMPAASDPKFTPENIGTYEKTLGVSVDRSIFEFLNRDTKLRTEGTGGAYYLPAKSLVQIPFDARRRSSKWGAKSVLYHEFGHAADWQNRFKTSELVTGLMEKYRAIYKKNRNTAYKELDAKLWAKYNEARAENDHDKKEQAGAALDTLMSLNTSFGTGHTKTYFKNPGMKEAEFIAHAFENRFAGNQVFKEVMPELYTEMIEMIDALKPTQ